jgi:hypothetical protein
VLALAICTAAATAAHATYGPKIPDLDAVSWKSLACDAPDMIHEASPSDVNFVGTKTHSPAFWGFDSKYLYFRQRMDSNPDSWCGFEHYSWTVLLTVPSGERDEYQYQLAFNGASDALELWKNTTRAKIAYSPLFTDDAETKLWSMPYRQTGGSIGNTKYLARSVYAGTKFNGGSDYFVDFAFPISVLVSKGVIGSASDLNKTSFFPVTATKPNKHDKSYLYCGFQPEIECVTASDCADGNACTTDTCNNGTCGNAAIAGCESCNQPSDCNDGNACTTETCNGGVCGHAAVQGCTPCSQPSDCNDGNACTTETCNGGVCGNVAIPSCTPCTTGADCNDGDVCSTDVCQAGACANAPVQGCTSCEDDVDCDDQDPCTADACGQDGSCQVTVIDGCQACDTAADCNDGDACTTDTCAANGTCETAVIDGCQACETADDCNDENACTTDTCGANGTCETAVIDGCQTCTTDDDCADDDACTANTCGGGVCQTASVEDCTVEVCDDGLDNDGDGDVDCADGDCAGNDLCPKLPEVCGDCTDNDGDNLIDAEDPDCCAVTEDLILRRMRLRMPMKGKDSKLRVRTRLGTRDRSNFKPNTQGATILVTDSKGKVFCQTIPMDAPRNLGSSLLYKFRDKSGKRAGGLQKANFRVRRSGKVVFRTNGKAMDLREPESRDLVVTLRVGDQCMRAAAPLRTKPAGHTMMFP